VDLGVGQKISKKAIVLKITKVTSEEPLSKMDRVVYDLGRRMEMNARTRTSE
jgi:hypothetical protein